MSQDLMDLTKPDCRLCDWFHADELDESKIFEVVGFKCCKCRRLRSPICPYLPPEKLAALEKKMIKKVPKQEISGMDSDSSIISAQGKEEALHVPACDEQLTEDKLLLYVTIGAIFIVLHVIRMSCLGLCHEQCVNSSTVIVNEEVEFLITCKQCYQTQALTRTEICNASPRSPLLQGRDVLNTATANKRGKQAIYNGSSASVGTGQRLPEVKSIDSSVAVNKGKKLSWGLIWRKKNCEDNGIDFRLKNILLKGNPHMDLTRPDCRLCSQPYNSDLMYVRCETCQHWFHADAVELDESKIFEVVGFKCCKCRRLRSPICPYFPPEKVAALEKKMMKKVPKQKISGMDSGSSIISAQGKEEALHVPADDPLLSSFLCSSDSFVRKRHWD
ncbi:unnamed protein product [Fraxinus pennsylvanica]|uniref:Uncharacterized protein n=1 Tax=Fraxinus pennsylvanica TaxID=56036 RepID=A0AAD2E4F6_9LAMI|nr:unnamed protein product [Fraxinus pennsylvanica]